MPGTTGGSRFWSIGACAVVIDDLIYPATRDRLSGILFRGGTVLGSSRSKRFYEYEHRETAFGNLKKHGIDKLVVVGGDGSFRALRQFHADFGVPFAGIPATIDNDIAGTDYCLGVDTALNMIQTSIDSIRDTALSFRRAFVIETMGRDCGYLAMVSALAAGAEICLVPEIEYDLDSIGRRLRSQIEDGRRYLIAIVAEGTKMGEYLTRWIGETLHVDSRLTVLGHVQRGGSPSVYDRLMAYKFSVAAIRALEEGATGDIVVYRSGAYELKSIDEVADAKHAVDNDIVQMCVPMCR